MININAEEFIKYELEKSDKDYGLCPPPTNAQEGLDILIKHFLGDDWCSLLPVSQEQVNTEAIYEILYKYSKKKSLLKKLFKKENN